MTTVRHDNLLFLGTEDDREHLPRLKPFLKGKRMFIDLRPVTTFAEVEIYARHPNRQITGVLTTSPSLLKKFTGKENPSLDAYAGSYFTRGGIEYVFCDPLEHCVTVPYGKFLIERWTSKLVSPESWLEPFEFNWRIADSSRAYDEAYQFLSECDLIACDIETGKEPEIYIKCIGYTGLNWKTKECKSYVIPINDMEAVYAMRRINATKAAKIFQNGKYDLSYLSRYSAPVYNYAWDTATAFHSWYSELPKDLAFLQAFLVRTAAYWKDLAETQDLEQYYLYNAKDTWATLHVLLAWIAEAPSWATKNYQQEFPLLFPCHLSEMIGVKRDVSKLETARAAIDDMVSIRSASLDKILGTSGFNVYSPLQMKSLFTILGCGDLKSRATGKFSAGDPNMAKAAFRHPLNARVIDLIRGVPKSDELDKMGIRALRKVKSTYLRDDDDAKKNGDGGSKDYKNRILYSLNPHGTDTGRLVSKEHHFWTGANIQQVPVGNVVKQTIIADEGFLFGECDLEQAEARDVAHISGDTSLIQAVTGTRDFHSINASAFFGISYESIYDDVKKKTLNKPLRNLSKRVNHGANYNMGPDVLVDTMGEKSIYEAARMLDLPSKWTAREIAAYLLERFDKTYPVIRGSYHKYLIECIVTTKKLVGATGWTRYCFSDPRASKPALNSYVAHPSQSLNAMVLNKAYMKVFYDVAMHPEHSKHFKLCAQIHDSILFQFRAGYEYLAELVRKAMEIPVTVLGADGKVRTFTVPAASKLGQDGKGAKYWSDTE
jgi:DNA polymerase I-like protein with 3'-5' exonuclease and polymerase domains